MSFAKSANTSYNTSAPQTNYTELNNGRQNNMSYGSGSQSNNSDGYEYLMEDLKANLKAFQENINNINRLSKKIGKREDSEQVRQNIPDKYHLSQGYRDYYEFATKTFERF